MLDLRHVVRPLTLARTALAAPYSVTRSNVWGDVAKVLEEQRRRYPAAMAPAHSKGLTATGEAQRRKRGDDHKWKPFQAGRVLRPHELSYKARFKVPRTHYTKKPEVAPPSHIARYADVFYQFNIDPLSQALNPTILSAFMTEMGKINHRNITGLTSKSQRRLGKAIRRAKMMGVIPVLSRPREVYKEQDY